MLIWPFLLSQQQLLRRQESPRTKLKSSRQARVGFAKVCFLPDPSMPTHAFAIHHFIGAARNAFLKHNVHVLRVTWLTKSVKAIKPKIVPIAFVKLAEPPIANQKFVHLAGKDCVVNRLKLVHVNASSVPSKRFCVQQAVNVYLKHLGVMEFRIALTTKRIV